MRQMWAWQQRTNPFLVCAGNCAATRPMEVTLHLCSAPGRPCKAQLCSPQVLKRSSDTGAGLTKGPEGVEELENLSGGETERAGGAQKLKGKSVLKTGDSLQLKSNI